jgi:hypothetical protein
MMISTSIILSTGEKKWMPMKFFGRFEFLASEVIGMRRGVGGDRLLPDGSVRLASAFS